MGYTKPGIALQSGLRDSVGLVWVKGTRLWRVFDLVHTSGLNAQIRYFAMHCVCGNINGCCSC